MFYYRLQPPGLGLDHYSEVTAFDDLGPTTETSDGLFVFQHLWQVLNTDGLVTSYGDDDGNVEILEIEGPDEYEDPGDFEGVLVDPTECKILRRWTPDEFAQALGFADWEELKWSGEAPEMVP